MLVFAFTIQMLGILGGFVLGRVVARMDRKLWIAAAILGVLLVLLGPIARLWPAVPLRIFGAALLSCLELTALFIPAAFVLAIGASRVPRAGDRRAIMIFLAVASLYCVRAGWWMIAPPLKDLGPARMRGEVCLQSTDYTCVAASMVTMLHARGIEATETEMARLARIEYRGGATDSRAIWALEQKLAGTGWDVIYRDCTFDELRHVPKPCMVQLNWGFAVSHMVPVMVMDADSVILGDPLAGERRMTRDEFCREWKGQTFSVQKRDTARP